jgi:hypothetical protein
MASASMYPAQKLIQHRNLAAGQLRFIDPHRDPVEHPMRGATAQTSVVYRCETDSDRVDSRMDSDNDIAACSTEVKQIAFGNIDFPCQRFAKQAASPEMSTSNSGFWNPPGTRPFPRR